ncbi:MAG: ABC transporter permease [Deltaproteobacteria bacterium]|nr:MAG: ABC transporter permease [Deltaproteobacteria bacterium]
MIKYIVRNIIQLIAVCFGIITMVFILTFIAGDPVLMMAPLNATPEEVNALRQSLGLNDPLPVQFSRYLLRVIQGDFGNSIRMQQPALRLVIERIPATIELGITSLLIATIVGVSVGILSAIKQNTWIDALGRLLALSGQSIPIFWFGLILIILFSVKLRFFPPFGYGEIKALIMPAVTLATYNIPLILRLTRSTFLEVIHQDYVRTAHAKGLPGKIVIFKHILPNAAIPIFTVIGMNFGKIVGGAIVTETVFAWPGVGLLTIDAIFTADYPIIMACTIILASSVVIVNFLTDLIYHVLDPRIRYS